MEKRQKSFEIDVPVNNLIYSTYQHFPYKPWDAFAELIDNATQSYLDHKTDLGSAVDVAIEYGPGAEGTYEISVTDNAFGMNETTLRRAVRLAEKPPDISGRCEFGMGMKTSCCWFGDWWQIKTKQFGETTAYTVDMDVPSFVSSSANKLTVVPLAAPATEHYTKITIRKLHREFRTRSLPIIRDRLGLAYQRDTAAGWLNLTFNGSPLKGEDLVLLIKDGKEQRKELDFKVAGHRISGWVGILSQGQGAKYSGFNLYRRGRLLMPHVKFTAQGLFPAVGSSLVFQRVTGELDLDSLPAVHLKNAIDFRDLQDDFEEKLAEEIKDIRAHAIETRYTKMNEDQKLVHAGGVVDSMLEQEDVVDQLRVADDLGDLVSEDEVLKPLENDAQQKPYLEKVVPIRGGSLLRIYFQEANPVAPYMKYMGHISGKGLDVFLNTSHPYIADADDTVFDAFLELAVLEALAEWVADKGPANPALARRVRAIKDALMKSKDADFASIS